MLYSTTIHLCTCFISSFRLKGERSPIKYIQFIHKKLFDICQQSGLEGLKYYGGPICRDCKDSEDEKIVVLRCVEYATEPDANTDANDETNADPTCEVCTEDYNVNELLLVCIEIWEI